MEKEVAKPEVHKCCDILNPEVISLLETQLEQECSNMRIYQFFAAYFNRIGLIDLKFYYEKRAEEEFDHYKRIVDFLNFNLVDYKLTSIPEVKFDFADSIEVFEKTWQLEMETTKMFYDIYDLALENQDYITMQWLMKDDGLINEQSEELNISHKALQIAKMNLDWISKADAIRKLL